MVAVVLVHTRGSERKGNSCTDEVVTTSSSVPCHCPRAELRVTWKSTRSFPCRTFSVMAFVDCELSHCKSVAYSSHATLLQTCPSQRGIFLTGCCSSRAFLSLHCTASARDAHGAGRPSVTGRSC